MRVLASSTGCRSRGRATTCGASGSVIAVVEIVDIAVVALDLIVDVVVGAAARAKRTGIFVALATIARQEILSRVTSEVVPIVVGAHSRQHLIVQRLCRRLLLLRGDIVAIQIAAVVQIV